MTRKPTALADIDIESEGLTHQDGLAERLARQRGQRTGNLEREVKTAEAMPVRDANAWRRGKALLQVAIPDDAHMELSIIAKRRRMTLSQVVKTALNDWLVQHGHHLRLPD